MGETPPSRDLLAIPSLPQMNSIRSPTAMEVLTDNFDNFSSKTSLGTHTLLPRLTWKEDKGRVVECKVKHISN